MRQHILLIALFVDLTAVTVACGSSSEHSANSGTPAPQTAADSSSSAFAVESGEYYLDDIKDLQDGCGKQPLNPQDAITQVPFNLTNHGDGTMAIDMCSYNDKSAQGSVRGNHASLYTLHQGRKVGNDSYPAVFDQECLVDLNVTADNSFSGRYTENQRNRNDAMRQATVDVANCTTAFTFTMKKR